MKQRQESYSKSIHEGSRSLLVALKRFNCFGHDFSSSFCLDDKELAVPYTTPFAMFNAACPYDPLAFTRDSAMNVGKATISATTHI
jgi:hypothetical protein